MDIRIISIVEISIAMAAPYKLPTSTFFTVNTLGLALALWGLKTELNNPLPPQLQEAGHYQFLTDLALIVTVLSIVSNYLIMIPEIGEDFFTVQLTAILNATALVFESLISSIYWTLRAIDPTLLFPDNEEERIILTTALDLTIHLFPVLFLSSEFFLNRSTRFPLKYQTVIAAISFFLIVYWVILESVVKDPYPYPYEFLNVDPITRAFVFVFIASLGFTYYLAFEFFHSVIETAPADGKKKDE